MRTREYVWSYFQPGVIGGKSYENRYNYQANSLRFGLGYKIKGIKFFLEAMNPTLFDLPSHGLAPSPAGALGLGANYFAIQKEGLELNLFLKQGYLESADSAIEGLDVKGGRFEFNEGQDLMPKDPQLRWIVTNQIAQRRSATSELDMGLSWKLSRYLQMSFYAGHFFGGSVVAANFPAGRGETFGYAEMILSF